jgi:hypothetical protein
MRLWQVAVLEDLSKKYGIDIWNEASKLFEQSGRFIIRLCEAAMNENNQTVAELTAQVADTEEQAYTLLEQSTPTSTLRLVSARSGSA